MKTPAPSVTHFSLHALELAVSKARAAARAASVSARESQALADVSYRAAQSVFISAEKVFSEIKREEDSK